MPVLLFLGKNLYEAQTGCLSLSVLRPLFGHVHAVPLHFGSGMPPILRILPEQELGLLKAGKQESHLHHGLETS